MDAVIVTALFVASLFAGLLAGWFAGAARALNMSPPAVTT